MDMYMDMDMHMDMDMYMDMGMYISGHNLSTKPNCGQAQIHISLIPCT